MATVLRNDAKDQIIDILREQGYPSYATLVDLFDIYLTDDPEVVGYMIPGKAKIVLNQGLSINQVSVIVRHEILHEYFDHGKRMQEFENSHSDLGHDQQVANVAADYEISNRGYTDADKATARAIILGDKVLRALVTEDDYPDWQDKSFEEMYEELLKKLQKEKDVLKKILDQLAKLSKKDLDDMQDEANSCSNCQPSDGGKKPSKGSGQGDDSKQGDDPNQQGDGQPTPAEKAKADQIAKELEKIKGALAGSGETTTKGGPDSSTEPFDSPEEQKEKVDLAGRVEAIRQKLDELKDAVLGDTANVKRQEKAAKAAKDVERYNSSPIHRFKLSLQRFIADQISELEDDSYARIHPSYEDSEFILPGKLQREHKNIPLINVYFDVSGSFSNPQKTEAARKAIATLNTYVQNEQIEIKVYYFATRVSDKSNKCGGGTNGQPVLDHIEQTKPNNVVVITDGDISDCSSTVKVPGAVWMLFYDSRSDNLISHLRGKRETRHYDVRY